MKSANQFAFKEWAVVCAALATGQQSLILRKGGIHEGREGFRVEHREFWLFPTGFHQEPESVTAAAQPLLQQVRLQQPPETEIPIQYYAEVEHVFPILEESKLSRLSPWHIWSEKTVFNRFHYKAPGLFAMLVRLHQLPDPRTIPSLPHFAGCRSWVDFPEPMMTSGLTPILPDEVHIERMQQLQHLLEG